MCVPEQSPSGSSHSVLQPIIKSKSKTGVILRIYSLVNINSSCSCIVYSHRLTTWLPEPEPSPPVALIFAPLVVMSTFVPVLDRGVIFLTAFCSCLIASDFFPVPVITVKLWIMLLRKLCKCLCLFHPPQTIL